MILRKQQIAHNNLLRAAFTLMEILVVVAIIVALAGMGGFYFIGQLQTSKKDMAASQCKHLEQAVETWQSRPNNHGIPTLQSLFQSDGTHPPILKKGADIKDPWGNDYQVHQLQTGQINVYSGGPPGGQPINKLE